MFIRIFRTMRSLLGFFVMVILAACSATTVSTSPAVASHTPMQSRAISLKLGVWHDMIYHDQIGKVVLVNGGPETGKSPNDALELWSWDGNQWSLLSADADGPFWRNFASVTYDSTRKVLVLYGGLQSESQTLDDTWEWDGIS